MHSGMGDSRSQHLDSPSPRRLIVFRQGELAGVSTATRGVSTCDSLSQPGGSLSHAAGLDESGQGDSTSDDTTRENPNLARRTRMCWWTMFGTKRARIAIRP